MTSTLRGRGLTKCRRSKGGCVDLVLWILPKCRQGGGRGSKIPKIVQTSFKYGPFGESSRQSRAEPVKQQHTGISPNQGPEAVRHYRVQRIISDIAAGSMSFPALNANPSLHDAHSGDVCKGFQALISSDRRTHFRGNNLDRIILLIYHQCNDCMLVFKKLDHSRTDNTSCVPYLKPCQFAADHAKRLGQG